MIDNWSRLEVVRGDCGPLADPYLACAHCHEPPDARAIDAAWLFAEADAMLALAAWRSAVSDDKAAAYATYRAALDREAQAARMLELRLEAART